MDALCMCVCELVYTRAFKCMLVFPLYTATAVRLHCCLVIRRVFLAALSNLLLLLVLPQTVYYVNVRICGVSDVCTRVGTLIVATIYLQLIQNRYMFQSFTVLQCSHQHCVQPVASDVEVVGYL